MERKKERSIKSIYDCLIKSREYEKRILSPKNIINSLESTNNDFSKIEEYINYLRNEVSKPKKNIKKIITDLESYLETGNNSNNINKLFFCSKIFIDCVDLLQLSRSEYILKILELLEKILNIKHVAKYVAKNENLLPKILVYLKDPSIKIAESAIKISETLLMNGLVPINNMYNIIIDIYNYMSKQDRLDAFCRILGILIFNCNKIEFKQLFRNKYNSYLEPLVKITTKNQIICIHFNNFFQNITTKLKKRLIFTTKIATNKSGSDFFNLFLSENGLSFIEPLANDSEAVNLNSTYGYLAIGNEIEGSNVKLTKKQFNQIIHINVFKSLKIDLNKLPKNTQNIYNLYKDISKHLKIMQNKNKINQNKKQYITLFKYGSYQIEMLFVLSTLLGSKRKTDVQNQLSKLNIIELLNSYLEYIEWGNIYSKNQRPSLNEENNNPEDDSAYHGNGCNCDCDSALKIQYLRLIYSFCCRDSDNLENKLKLFSEKDVQMFLDTGYIDLIKIILRDKYNFYKNQKQVKFNKEFISLIKILKLDDENDTERLKNTYKNIESLIFKLCSPDNIKNLIQFYNKSDNEMGLFIKLIFKYMQECYFSSARFWISSCIEVILRGNNSFVQTFTIYSGLLYCLMNDILYGKQDKNQTLQISFDILGELVKFNRCSIFMMDYCLCDNVEFIEFNKKVLSKDTLIDSNVFLRALLLSIYFFDLNDKNSGLTEKEYFTNNSKICKFIKDNLSTLFLSLITIVKVIHINQTNISCINTALIILIMKYLQNKQNLAIFLKEFREKEGKSGLEGLDNYKLLLKMWKKFYNYRSKDSTSLLYSSTIDFNIWQKVTNILLNEDINDPCSLYFAGK
jgi:hypothetical protein